MKFFIKDNRETVEDAREVPQSHSDYPTSPAEFAEVVAGYYYDREDGWDRDWPSAFSIVLDDGTTKDLIVELKVIPEFKTVGECK